MKNAECIYCGVQIGSTHHLGCSVERCPFCGGAVTACHCVYYKLGEDLGWDYKPPMVKKRNRVTGLIEEPDDIPSDYTCLDMLNQDYYVVSHKTDGLPRSVHESGLTEAMEDRWIELLEGIGRIPWTGEWPGSEECREYSLWCKRVDDGWVPCDAKDPRAVEDLHRLTEVCEWSSSARRYVKRKKN